MGPHPANRSPVTVAEIPIPHGGTTYRGWSAQHANRQRTQEHPRPPPLLLAVLDALPQHDRVPDLLIDQRVAAEVDQIGTRLVQRGWYLSARARTRVKRFAPGWFVATWCLLQFVLTLPHFSEPGRALQALGLLGLSVFSAIGTYVIVDLPSSTRAGRAAPRAARQSTRGESLMREIATGGEAAFWRDGAYLTTRPAYPSSSDGESADDNLREGLTHCPLKGRAR